MEPAFRSSEPSISAEENIPPLLAAERSRDGIDEGEGNEVPPAEADRRAVTLAGRQHGVIGIEQLERAGLGRHAVAHRVATSWLRPIHRGVYLVGPLESPHSRSMAATVAAGAGAVVSHRAAAVLWDLLAPVGGPIDVTVPRKVRGRPGITPHRAALHPADVTRRHGIPVTSAARTLLDLAGTEPAVELDRALNEAGLQRRISRLSLTEQFSRYPRHRGTASLKMATEGEPHLTRSDAEILMRDLIRRAGLPAPEANVRIEGHEVDLVWRAQRLVVEIDSWAFHSLRRSFEGDRRRDQRLVGAGWRVIRITARQLTHEAERVVATLATALAA